MAKYTINYACEHGSREKQLYGKETERQRRIQWMEANVKCPNCAKADRIAQDNARPRQATIHVSGVPMVIAVELTGQIENNKEKLQSAGWNWTNEPVGALGLLTDTGYNWRFIRTWTYRDEDTLRAAILEIVSTLEQIGYATVKPLSALDMTMAREAIKRAAAEKAAKDAILAANPRPTRPAWYASHVPPGTSITCNRKVYGSREKSIYVNNTRISVTADQVKEIETYWTLLDAWNKAHKS